MKFSFGCAHVWRQRALGTAAAAAPPARHPPFGDFVTAGNAHSDPYSLFCSTRRNRRSALSAGSPAWNLGVRAHGVCARALQLLPHDAALRLVAANTCYNMGWVRPHERASALARSRPPLTHRSVVAAGGGHRAGGGGAENRGRKRRRDGGARVPLRRHRLPDEGAGEWRFALLMFDVFSLLG